VSARRSTVERDYGAAHQRERKRWAPAVERGDVDCHAVVCLEDDRHIEPGTAWDLGHTPDRTSWTGPEHARCNRSEGATRGNAQRSTHAPELVLREW
jgi:hypothetical protein